MRYCETCQRLLLPDGQAVCDACGEPLRQARENDPVLLISAGAMRADMIAPLLDGAGIPYARQGDMGVGFTMWAGRLLETYRFFVPYGAYPRAHDLIASTFGEDAEIMAALL